MNCYFWTNYYFRPQEIERKIWMHNLFCEHVETWATEKIRLSPWHRCLCWSLSKCCINCTSACIFVGCWALAKLIVRQVSLSIISHQSVMHFSIKHTGNFFYGVLVYILKWDSGKHVTPSRPFTLFKQVIPEKFQLSQYLNTPAKISCIMSW
jgi:hypothetical protein